MAPSTKPLVFNIHDRMGKSKLKPGDPEKKAISKGMKKTEQD